MNDEINPFELHAMVGIAVLEKNLIKQIRPKDDGIAYSLRYNSRRFVLCPEWGIGEGHSVVVCSVEGKFLKPISESRMFQRFSFPYSFNKVFYGKELITVETHYNLENNCSINLHQIKNSHIKDIYKVNTETIWGGFYKDLPKNMECFCKAINLAEKRKYGK